MNAILLIFDSLNRRMLPPYGCDWTIAPNFTRLAERSVTCENAYVGSMPCIPARRELHTGRYNFLHRSWGPLEPFDDSTPALLKQGGVYTHLTTDHQHYFEDGGTAYHTRYNTWEFHRGQEGDPWIAQAAEPRVPANLKKIKKPTWRQDWVNRTRIQAEPDYPQHRTIAAGLEFLQYNRTAGPWFLQIECFDPHEPFMAPEPYRRLYPEQYAGPHFDWPDYDQVSETPEQAAHARREYAALLSYCDASLGRVLDAMDEHHLWDDTLLIVTTDHGIMLGEHGWWMKNFMPLYNEIANIPLFVWDPRYGQAGARRSGLVQWIDLSAHLLETFGLPRPPDMQGRPLGPLLTNDTPIRKVALFGYHGGHANLTDGRYVYLRGPKAPNNRPLYEYTLAPGHIKNLFEPAELQQAELSPPFSFSKACPLLKIPGLGSVGAINPYLWGTLLFDLQADPGQLNPLDDAQLELRLATALRDALLENDAPPEQYLRLGLPPSGPLGAEHLDVRRAIPGTLQVGRASLAVEPSAALTYYTCFELVPYHQQAAFARRLEAQLTGEQKTWTAAEISALLQAAAPPGLQEGFARVARLAL